MSASKPTNGLLLWFFFIYVQLKESTTARLVYNYRTCKEVVMSLKYQTQIIFFTVLFYYLYVLDSIQHTATKYAQWQCLLRVGGYGYRKERGSWVCKVSIIWFRGICWDKDLSPGQMTKILKEISYGRITYEM